MDRSLGRPAIPRRTIRHAMERRRLERAIQESTDELSRTVEALRAEVRRCRQAEDALRESEVHHRFLVENALDVIYAIAPDGTIVSVNPAIETTTGWTPEEWIGRSFEPLVHPDDLAYTVERVQKALQGARIPPAELRIRTKTGEYRLFEFKTLPTVRNGEVIGIMGTAHDITERKQAEETIRRQNAFLKSVLESLTHPFYVLDARDYTIKMANTAAAPEGLPPSITCHALTHHSGKPCNGSEHSCPLEVVKRTKRPVTVEHVHYDQAGNPRNVEVHAYPIFDPEGQVAQILEYSFDITERKRMEAELLQARDELEARVRERTEALLEANATLQAEIAERRQAEEALRRSEERYRELVENANSIILRMDVEGRVTYFNEFAETFFGFSKHEILGRNVVGTIVPPTESSGRDLAAMIHDIARDPEQYSRNENENIRRNGERVWVLWTNKVLFDERGRISEILCIGSDITERRRAEEALRLDENRLEALLELSQMAKASIKEIADFTLEQQVRLTKSRIGWLGFLDEEETVLTLQAWSDAVMGQCALPEGPLHLPVVRAGLWAEAIRQRKAVIVNDYRAPHPNKLGLPGGHVPLARFMVVPVFEGPRIRALAAVGNKTEDYDAADMRQLALLMDGMWKLIQREQALKALRESESLAEMGRALSSVAHDIKTPLIAIGGFSRLVQNHLEPQNPDREKLDIVIRETQRLEGMVKEMLDFSRPLELHREPEDLDRILEESAAVVEAIAREREVSLQLPPAPFPLQAPLDAMRLKQALINLLTNAVQASSPGQTVTLAHSLRRRVLRVEIIDHGPGIPPEKREEVFFPFYTTKKEGTGLGLPIVRKIIEAHEGRIRLLDSPGGGLTVRLELPLPPQEPVAKAFFNAGTG